MAGPPEGRVPAIHVGKQDLISTKAAKSKGHAPDRAVSFNDHVDGRDFARP
jgi:hypothetical protein